MQARGYLMWMGPGADRICRFLAVAARTPLKRGACPDAVAGYHRFVRACDRSVLVPGRLLPQARRTTVDSAVARFKAGVQGDGITGTSARCQGIQLGGHRHGLVRCRAQPRDDDAPLHPVARLLLLDGEMAVAVTTRIPAGRWAQGPTCTASPASLGRRAPSGSVEEPLHGSFHARARKPAKPVKGQKGAFFVAPASDVGLALPA
jgi:hypothetical protein